MRVAIGLVLSLGLACCGVSAADTKQDQLRKQYETSLAKLGDDDDAGYQRLALWCTAKHLTKEAEHVWQVLFQRKRERLAAHPTLAGYQGLLSWCQAQGLKQATADAKHDLAVYDYQIRKAKLAADDLKGLQDLASWCQKTRLNLEALDTLRTIFALQPDNLAAQKQFEAVRAAAWAEAPVGLLRNQKVPGYQQETAWFHISVPKDYGEAKNGLPLVIFLHGGAHNAGSADHIVALAETIPAFKTVIVLFPNHLKTWWPHPREMAYLLDTIDQVQTRWHVDPERIGLMGVSMGGNGTWGFGSQCPELFAALAPMAGFWAPFLEFPMQNLKSKPIYVLHGTQDRTVPIDGARQAFALMKATGADIVMREPECGHQLPNDEIAKAVDWLLHYRNQQGFNLKELKERVGKLAVPGWLKQYEGN